MRIAFDAKRAFHNSSGLGNYSRTLITDILRLYPELDLSLFTPPITDKSLFDFPKNDRIETIAPKSNASFWRTFGMRHEVNKQKPTVFHGLSNELPRGLKCPKVVTIHDLIFKRFPKFYNRVDRNIYHLKVKHAVKRADKIIAISQQTKDDICDMYKVSEDRVDVIYQACHPRYADEAPQQARNYVINHYNLHDPFILSVGTFNERKNQLELLKAFRVIQNQHPEYLLVLIGTGGKYKEKVETFIDENDLYGKVILIENCSDETLHAFYSLASMFVYPSLFEGFGIPIIEAMHAGLPVVTSTGSCFPETGGDAALYADPHSHEAIASAIHQVLSQPALAKEMKSKGQAHVSKFAAERVTKQWIDLYSQVGQG